MTRGRLRLTFAMAPEVLERIFTPERIAAFAEVVDVAGILADFESDAARRVLAETEILVTGWGVRRSTRSFSPPPRASAPSFMRQVR